MGATRAKSHVPHRVAVIASDDVVVADLALAGEVLGRTRLADGAAAYEVWVASERPTVRTEHFELRVPHRLDTIRTADTVIVPGRAHPIEPTPAHALTALREAAGRGARVASICVGAFMLAEAGLLDGHRATTHWAAAAELARHHPAVDVDPNVLFVDNGAILTSAGAAAGFDLLLHLIGRDFGRAVAAETARAIVMPLARHGGQAQYIASGTSPETRTLAPVLDWIEANIHDDIDLSDIAAAAAMSKRTLNRRFLEATATTPTRWLRQQRIRRSQQLLETTDLSVETIAAQVGFGSVAAFRQHFADLVSTSPSSYRKTFRPTTS